jgi:hypothetical protein
VVGDILKNLYFKNELENIQKFYGIKILDNFECNTPEPEVISLAFSGLIFARNVGWDNISEKVLIIVNLFLVFFNKKI